VAEIQLIIYDFDGVMTDNKVFLMDDGHEAVVVNRSDGLAVAKIKEMGISQIIVTSETNPVVAVRARKLGIPILQAVTDKKTAVKKLLKERGIDVNNVVFIGNDLNDEDVMRFIGWPIASGDACPRIKKIARVVLSANGGCGVVREFLNFLTKEAR